MIELRKLGRPIDFWLVGPVPTPRVVYLVLYLAHKNSIIIDTSSDREGSISKTYPTVVGASADKPVDANSGKVKKETIGTVNIESVGWIAIKDSTEYCHKTVGISSVILVNFRSQRNLLTLARSLSLMERVTSSNELYT